MANTQAQFGFRHIGFLPGYGPDYQQLSRQIQSSNATKIFNGDPVIKSTGTNYIIQGSNNTATLEGIFVGCNYVPTGGLLTVQPSPYWVGSAASDAPGYLINAPGALFLAAALNTAIITSNIGANIGFFSLLAARLVGPDGHVTSFEADPEVAGRLREHIARNNFSRVTVEQKAVWSERRRVTFLRTDPGVSPDRGLGHVVGAASSDTIEVEGVSLDDYTAAFPAPDFLKCDVEGAEVEVFRGAGRLLREKRPGILCEMHSEENRRVLVDELRAHASNNGEPS